MSVWIVIQRVSAGVVVVLAIAMVAGIFYPRLLEYRDLQKQHERLQEEIRFEEEMLKHLKSKQQRLLTDPRFVERIAREELGLARPGETVFKFTDDVTTNLAGKR